MSFNDAPGGSAAREPHAAALRVGRLDVASHSAGALARALGTIFEIVFLGYLSGIAGFGRDFAHLHLTVHGVPLFMGELALLTLTVLASATHVRRHGLRFELDPTSWGLLILFAVGAALTVRGLATSPTLAVLRDFALVYYAWFFLLTLAYLRQGGRGKRLLGALLVGAVVGATADLGRFLAAPSLAWGHAASSYDGLYGWCAIVVALAVVITETGLLWRIAAAGAIVVCTFQIFLTGYKTLAVVAAVSVIALTVWGTLQGGRAARRFVALAWVWVPLMAALILVPGALIKSPPRVVPTNGPVVLQDALASVSYRWTGRRFGTFPTLPASIGALPDPQTWKGSAAFRFSAWSNAIERIKASPWLGIGFGTQALLFPQEDCDTLPSPTSNCGAAHNTYVTLAMRLGIPAALFFCVLLGSVLARSAILMVRPGDSVELLPTVAAAVMLLAFLTYGLTGLLLESPYLSPVVWVLAAILSESARLAAREKQEARG